MKVYKFYVKECFYYVSGKTFTEAMNHLIDIIGECIIDTLEFIDESKWDEKFIGMYEDNDTRHENWKSSIRDLISNTSEILCTNDDLIIN